MCASFLPGLFWLQLFRPLLFFLFGLVDLAEQFGGLDVASNAEAGEHSFGSFICSVIAAKYTLVMRDVDPPKFLVFGAYL